MEKAKPKLEKSRLGERFTLLSQQSLDECIERLSHFDEYNRLGGYIVFEGEEDTAFPTFEMRFGIEGQLPQNDTMYNRYKFGTALRGYLERNKDGTLIHCVANRRAPVRKTLLISFGLMLGFMLLIYLQEGIRYFYVFTSNWLCMTSQFIIVMTVAIFWDFRWNNRLLLRPLKQALNAYPMNRSTYDKE